MATDSLGTMIECKREIRRLKQKAKLAKTEEERKAIREKILHYENLSARIKSLSTGKIREHSGIANDVEVRTFVR